MVAKADLIMIEPLLYEIPKAFRQDMRVPARIYADDLILESALRDRSMEQLLNTTTLPGIVGYALAMPDMHQGYGFPIGGVAATALPDGVISPGGVGYDINCGVRLLTSSMGADALRPHLDRLMTTLFDAIPSGVGGEGGLGFSAKDLQGILQSGASAVIAKGYGHRADLERTEDRGCMPDADPAALSARARSRGARQVGSLGSGNHFLEVDEIVQVYDMETASLFGLREGDVCVWIHCGSRGLGHQVCTDAVREMQTAVGRYRIEIPDRELVCAPFQSEEGQGYYRAMCCAANYAWANRQAITHLVRQSFDRSLAGRLSNLDLRVLYDVCHNVAKVEKHEIDGRMLQLCVHRKGATRAFGPGRREVPQDLRSAGQPVLIPGNMEAGSYVLVGTDKAMRETFGSSCHGAGRLMSRTRARKQVRGDRLVQELGARNIIVRTASLRGLAEEAPVAYKNLDNVVDVVHDAGIARRVARTKPMGVIKG